MKQAKNTVSFGFKDVAVKEKEGLVGKVFSEVASSYDLMNDLMSAGVHRLWKNFMIKEISPRPNMSILDVAGGTGDISFRMINEFNDASITLCDINPDMIEVGKQRASERGLRDRIEWICGNAAALPFEENSFDVYTIAFGLRNVTDIPAALEEAHRTLKPGGQYLCLEFSEVVLPVLKVAYENYSFKVIPEIGHFVAKNRDAYQYLVESIARFPNQKTLERMMMSAGFQHVGHKNLAGGIAALHVGWKV